jgi:hypothetical protein
MSFPVDIYKWGLAQLRYLPTTNVQAATGIRLDGTDPDGTNAAKLQALFATPGRYYLPAGRILAPGLTIPGSVEVFGSPGGWDRTNSVWTGGTILLGGVQMAAASKYSHLHDFGIDNAANTVTAQGGNGLLCNGTGFYGHRFERLKTRGNDHNILIEQNGTDPQGGVAQGGGVVVHDCEGFGGPNGIAIKAYDVTVERVRMSDITVQAFVSVSDNINGATTYSRSQFVRFIDCGGDNNQAKLRVYSRDTRSLNNANGVQPQYWITWDGGDLGACGQYGAQIGDFSAQTSGGPVGTQTLLPNRHVFIKGAKCDRNGNNGMLFLHVDTGGVDFCHFENNGLNAGFTNKHIDYSISSSVLNLSIGLNNTFRGPSLGKEQGITVVPAGATSFTTDTGAKLYRSNNTVPTTISVATSQRPGEEHIFQIADAFTTLSYAKDASGAAVVKTGLSTIYRAMWDSVNSAMIYLGGT